MMKYNRRRLLALTLMLPSMAIFLTIIHAQIIGFYTSNIFPKDAEQLGFIFSLTGIGTYLRLCAVVYLLGTVLLVTDWPKKDGTTIRLLRALWHKLSPDE